MTGSKISLMATALGGALLLSGCGTQLPDTRPAFGYSGLQESEAGLSTYARGKADFAAGRYGLAIERFRMAMGEQPDSIEAVNGLAAAYDQIGRFDLAERYYRRALAMDPNSAQTLNNLGYSMLMQGKADTALALFRDATQRAPDNEMIAANAQLAVAARVESAARERAAEPEQQPTPASRRAPPSQRPSIIRINSAEQRLKLRTGPVLAPMPPQVTPVPLPAVETRSLPEPGLPESGSAEPELATDKHPAEPQPAPLPMVRVALRPGEGEVLLPAGPAQGTAKSAARDTEAMDVTMDLDGSVEIANGAGRRHMAARMRVYLASQGLQVVRLSNADHFAHAMTTVSYLPGHRDLAEVLSASLPIVPRLEEVAGQFVGVRVELGGDLLEFDRVLLEAERKASHDDPV